MSLPARLLGANPSIQVSTLLSGSLSTPSAKGQFTPVGDMILIQSVTTTGTQTSVTFSSIPQTYSHLYLYYSGRGTQGSVYSNGTMELNGNTSGYMIGYIESAGGATIMGSSYSRNQATTRFADVVIAGSGATGIHGAVLGVFPNYTTATKHGFMAQFGSTDSSTQQYMGYQYSAHDNSAALTSIVLSISTGFLNGSTFHLYGTVTA